MDDYFIKPSTVDNEVLRKGKKNLDATLADKYIYFCTGCNTCWEVTKTKWQKYATEGDLQQYSTENAMKRERLRNNPEIIALIDHWWTQVILAKYDKDHDELLNKQGKRELFVF